MGGGQGSHQTGVMTREILNFDQLKESLEDLGLLVRVGISPMAPNEQSRATCSGLKVRCRSEKCPYCPVGSLPVSDFHTGLALSGGKRSIGGDVWISTPS
jgi:hypothetical protein